MSMAAPHAGFLKRWHAVVAERDVEGLEALFAPDIRLSAPPYWESFEGRPIVHFLVGRILHTIDDFTYHREWHADAQGGREIALEFHGRVGETRLQGIDLISLDDQDRVRNLDVLIRPMNALEALRDIIAPQMTEYLRNLSR